MVENMPTILTEKNLNGSVLTFEFSDKWQVCKYDDQLFYKKLKGLQAVDFIALSDKGLLLMEIKYVLASDEKSRLLFYANSDNDKLENIKSQLTKAQQKIVIINSARPYLVDEVSKKVKDTLLGLLASYRQGDATLSPYTQSLFTHNNHPILVLLFLERNAELNQEENFKPLASNLKLAIEQKLSFLGNIQVGVVNSLTLPSALEINILENISYSSL
jgi:uncharacterized protein YbgA (DUF1722 family)